MHRRSTVWILIFVAVLAAAVALASCSKKKEETKPPVPAGNVSIQTTTNAPNVTLRAPNGTTETFSALQGKIVFICFFATWNPESKQEIPILNKLQEDYARYNVAVVGIAIDTSSPGALGSFTAANPVKFPVYYNGSEIVPKFGGIRKLPSTVVLTRSGAIYKKLLGLQTFRAYEDLLREIMGQRL